MKCGLKLFLCEFYDYDFTASLKPFQSIFKDENKNNLNIVAQKTLGFWTMPVSLQNSHYIQLAS